MEEPRNSLATSQIEEEICWFAWTVWENLLYSRYLGTSGTRIQHKWIIHAATVCCMLAEATITSELVIIVVKFKNFKIKLVKVHTGQSVQVFIRGRPVDVGIAMPDRFNVVNETYRLQWTLTMFMTMPVCCVSWSVWNWMWTNFFHTTQLK